MSLVISGLERQMRRRWEREIQKLEGQCVCLRLCVCVFGVVRLRERERERERDRERQRAEECL